MRILTRLERRYAEFDGLNLTWETLEGTVKHNGPLRGPGIDRPVPPTIAEYDAAIRSALDTFPGAEAQVAALADDIAYNNHDIDDGLRAGLFAVADLAEVPLVGPVFRRGRGALSGARGAAPDPRIDPPADRPHGRRSDRRDAVGGWPTAGSRSAAEIRALRRRWSRFSAEMRANDRALKDFLFERMYRHYRVNRMSSKARRVVHDLFALYLAEPECLPGEWRGLAAGPDDPQTARVVADYLAGMTDRYALDEHHRLFDTYVPT